MRGSAACLTCLLLLVVWMVCVSRTRGNVAPPLGNGHHPNRVSPDAVANRSGGRWGAAQFAPKVLAPTERQRFDVDSIRHVLPRHPPDGLYLSLIHISEPTRRTPISYAVFCLKKKNK